MAIGSVKVCSLIDGRLPEMNRGSMVLQRQACKEVAVSAVEALVLLTYTAGLTRGSEQWRLALDS